MLLFLSPFTQKYIAILMKDFGYSMQLNMISKADGSSWIIILTGSPIVFLRATTNGMPDLLVSDCWLYRWNGDEYLMQ